MQDAISFTFTLLGTGTPSPTPTIDPDTVTPGPEGFLVMALIAVAVILLIADMMRRIRRGRVRADVNEQLDAEQAAREQRAKDPGGQPSPREGDAGGVDGPTEPPRS